MEHELITFVAFVGIQTCVHLVAHLKHCSVVSRVAATHVAAVVVHPTVLHAVQDYAIHFVVYSGYILHH